jgi:phosphomannomutase
MRQEDAVYGGEMSAHHYFRDFSYCDSGMIPWLLVAELLCVKNQAISTLVKDRITKFPSSGEINFKVKDADTTIKAIKDFNWAEDFELKLIDGSDLIFSNWRLNVRSSNTEPVIRLNIETKNDRELLNNKLKCVQQIISKYKS